jgi:hypothetical protein
MKKAYITIVQHTIILPAVHHLLVLENQREMKMIA